MKESRSPTSNPNPPLVRPQGQRSLDTGPVPYGTAEVVLKSCKGDWLMAGKLGVRSQAYS